MYNKFYNVEQIMVKPQWWDCKYAEQGKLKVREEEHIKDVN